MADTPRIEGSKSWYKSRNIWTGIVTTLIGAYVSLDQMVGPDAGFNLPNIPEWIFVLLGAVGVYTRSIATTTITK